MTSVHFTVGRSSRLNTIPEIVFNGFLYKPTGKLKVKKKNRGYIRNKTIHIKIQLNLSNKTTKQK